jgi:hypothetical protein
VTKDQIKLIVVGAVAMIAVAGVAGVGYKMNAAKAAHVAELEEQLTATKDDLAGFSKYTTYLDVAKQSIIDGAKDLATTTVEEVTWVERVQKGGDYRDNATVVLKLSIEYTFGFDTAADKFELALANKGLEVTVGTPGLIGTPAVTLISSEFPPKVLVGDEETAAKEIMQRITPGFAEKGKTLAQNEAIRIICEKKLLDHLRDYFGKQKDVKLVPATKVSYK